MIVIASNGHRYIVFVSFKAALKWAAKNPRFARVHPVNVDGKAGFLID
jgi:hypothetical protein